MKCLFAAALVTVISLTAHAQKAPSKKDARAAAELMQLERDIGQANVRRDKAFFERVEAEEFIFTDSGGITTKAEDVASLDKPPGEFKLVSYDVGAMKIYVYKNSAVVTGRVTTVSKSKDREVTGHSRFTDVFVKRQGRWQIVAGHSSRIREQQK